MGRPGSRNTGETWGPGKILCHNLVALIHEMCELGIDPVPDCVAGMSKGKYKRKRERARQKAEEEVNDIGLSNSEAVAPEKQPEPTKKSNAKGGDKKEIPMGFSEAVKRSSFTDWCIAAFTLVLSVVAIYQYIVMGGQLDTMRKDQRPWLKVVSTADYTKIVENATVMGTTQVFNFGKTPAKNVFVEIAVERLQKDESPKLADDVLAMTAKEGVIFPNATDRDPIPFGIVKDATQRSDFEPISKDDARKFAAGELFYVIYGRAVYTDFFKTQHWTQFCRWLATPPPPQEQTRTFTAARCIKYNDLDDD
jgi:hypothetical protein